MQLSYVEKKEKEDWRNIVDDPNENENEKD